MNRVPDVHAQCALDLTVNFNLLSHCFPSYRQAQAAVLKALPWLHHQKVPTRRPDDYFAEMAKSDQQMQKVLNLDWHWMSFLPSDSRV